MVRQLVEIPYTKNISSTKIRKILSTARHQKLEKKLKRLLSAKISLDV